MALISEETFSDKIFHGSQTAKYGNNEEKNKNGCQNIMKGVLCKMEKKYLFSEEKMKQVPFS